MIKDQLACTLKRFFLQSYIIAAISLPTRMIHHNPLPFSFLIFGHSETIKNESDSQAHIRTVF